MSRAGATAKTFGVDIDNLIGHVTAIGSVTMQSGEQIGTALRTIYSRITTNDGAVAAIEEIGVAISELNEETGEYANKDVSDILGEIAGKWDTLSSAQQQNLGIAIAGTNRLTQLTTKKLSHIEMCA